MIIDIKFDLTIKKGKRLIHKNIVSYFNDKETLEI